jgi:hypothetical protein
LRLEQPEKDPHPRRANQADRAAPFFLSRSFQPPSAPRNGRAIPSHRDLFVTSGLTAATCRAVARRTS